MTGASRGIGEAIALDLGARGAKVVLTYSSDRSREAANKTIARIESEGNSAAIGVQCNLKEIAAPKQIVEETIKAFGPHIDILVNNAAVISGSYVADITPEHFDEALHMLEPALDNKSVRTTFESENADAVWLVRLRNGLVCLPQRPDVDTTWKFPTATEG